MLKHDLVEASEDISEVLDSHKVISAVDDGVNNVQFTTNQVQNLPLYTLIKIRLKPPDKV